MAGLTVTVWGLLVVGTLMGEVPPVIVTNVALAKVTVRVAEAPATIIEALGERATVGAGLGVTVTVVTAVIFPPAPVAVAV